MTKNNSWIAIGLVGLMAFSTDVLATRGRVQVSNNTIKTDRGTLLRGARCSLDIWDETPSQSDIDGMKNRGLNALHIYAEYPGSGKAGGYNSALVDNVVNLADQNGLYVILTIGSGGANGSFNQTFVTQFWNFYAPRYKDRTHVIYEICNEPQAWSAPYNSATLNMEKNAFNQIRGLAPNTHIMLMSYSQVNNWTQAANECAGLGISWGNASVAFHTYGIDGNENNALTSFFNAMKSKGIAYACTEPNLNLQVITTKIFEANGVSETFFISAHDIASNNSSFYDWINSNGIHWTPDYGTWPSSGSGSGPANGTYKLINRNSGKAMEAQNFGTTNGTQIQQWTYVSGSNQKWTITSLGSSLYEIIGVQSGKSIDISNWGTANDTKVQLWNYLGGTNQKFYFNATSGGYYEISPSHCTGSCLDVSGNSTADGAIVHLWQWLNANNQQWIPQAP